VVVPFSAGGIVHILTRIAATSSKRFNEEINAALKSSDVIERLRKADAFAEGGTPDDFTKFLAGEGTRWTKLVKEASIKAD
jgi:tripartite-type tricarboxylate transporter receptor subunit TctC